MNPYRSRTRVAAFVAGGEIALAALEALAEAHTVVAIVRPQPRRGPLGVLRTKAGRIARRSGLVARDEVAEWARTTDVPTITLAHGDDARATKRLSELRPDYGCIATFPRRIGPGILAAAGAVCVNVHSSLLPKHRGANPLFWTYHADDREGGVTVHVATSELDAGPILSSASCRIARGESVTDVHRRYAALVGPLLTDAMASLTSGTARPQAQDESGATAAPRVQPGKVYSSLEEWGTERSWHFLAGLADQHREPFSDELGRPVRYSRVLGFEIRTPLHAAGTVTRDGAQWCAWASDGVVYLAS